MKNRMFFLKIGIFFLTFGLLASSITNNISSAKISNDLEELAWETFELACSKPDNLIVFDTQTPGSFVDPVDLILEINISSLVDGKLTVDVYKDESLDKRINNPVVITETGFRSFNLKANMIVFYLEPVKSESLVSSSIQGSYEIKSESINVVVEKTDFSLYNSDPYSIEIFNGQGFVHNLTVHLNVTELTNESLELQWSKGDTVQTKTLEFKESYVINIEAANVRISLFAPNGSYAEGLYQVMDNGQLYRDVPGNTLFIIISTFLTVFLVNRIMRIHRIVGK